MSLRVGISRVSRLPVLHHRLQLPSTATGRQFFCAQPDQAAVTDVSEEAAELKAKVEALETKHAEEAKLLQDKLKDFQDKYMRSLAETENVRTRMKKQVDDAKLFGIQGFCKDLLEVADTLGKATESVPADKLTDDNPALVDLFSGLTMTHTELQKVFARHGLLPISPADGEKFDPNFHEALFQQPLADKEAGTVCAITKVGYKLHERTIRPALVGVRKAP